MGILARMRAIVLAILWHKMDFLDFTGKLDPSTNDLQVVRGVAAVSWLCEKTLLTRQGDCIFDTSLGLPYNQLKINPSDVSLQASFVDSAIDNLLSIENVVSAQNNSVTINGLNLVMVFSIQVANQSQSIPISVVV